MVTAPFLGHQIVVKRWVRGDRALHSARTLRQKMRDAITAPLHRSATNFNRKLGARRARTSCSTTVQNQRRGRCTLPWASNRIQKVGERRPRTSLSTHATAENQGRDHRATPTAPNRSQKLGAWQPRTSGMLQHAHCSPRCPLLPTVGDIANSLR